MKSVKTIFIIDDDPIIVFGVKKLLSQIGYTRGITAYENGKIAIDALQKLIIEKSKMPDVIFLDINMPIMDGWEFLEAFIKLPLLKKVRINIVTSSIDPIDKYRANMYQEMTNHPISFNNKPIKKIEIKEIMKIE